MKKTLASLVVAGVVSFGASAPVSRSEENERYNRNKVTGSDITSLTQGLCTLARECQYDHVATVLSRICPVYERPQPCYGHHPRIEGKDVCVREQVYNKCIESLEIHTRKIKKSPDELFTREIFTDYGADGQLDSFEFWEYGNSIVSPGDHVTQEYQNRYETLLKKISTALLHRRE